MKKTKRNNLLIVLIVFLLALAVGYATFQQVLNITGTASVAGTWDVKFVDPTTITENHGTATKTADDEITVAASLAFPGDACAVTVHIKNEGTIPAKLTSLDLLNADGSTPFSDNDIKIEIPEMSGDKLDAGETCELTFTIAWDEESKAASKDVGFKIKFTYDQDTTFVNELTTNHTTPHTKE